MIDLKDLRHLIVGEINKAEKQVIKDVHLSLGNAKEDEITTLFLNCCSKFDKFTVKYHGS